MHPMTFRLPVNMLPQPDETTCGPTCLHAVYRYWGTDVTLAEVIERTRKLEHGGTFAIFLACDALRQGDLGTGFDRARRMTRAWDCRNAGPIILLRWKQEIAILLLEARLLKPNQ